MQDWIGCVGFGQSNLLPYTSEDITAHKRRSKAEDLVSKLPSNLHKRDFTGVVDDEKKLKGCFYHEHWARATNAIGCIEADHDFLAMNLASVGKILNRFVVELCIDVLELKPTIEMIVRTYLGRTGLSARSVADYGPRETSVFAKDFYAQIDPIPVMWFRTSDPSTADVSDGGPELILSYPNEEDDSVETPRCCIQ